MSKSPAPTAQLVTDGSQHPAYAIVLNHIPSEAGYAAFVCEDFDAPSCRSRKALSSEEVSDPFLQELLASGVSLESLHQQPCPFVHFLACNVPLQGPMQRFSLDEKGSLGIAGINTHGQLGFYPPSPPAQDPAVHRYQLRVIFLRRPLELNPGFSAEDLDVALRQAGPEVGVGECQAQLDLTAAQLRHQRSRLD